MLIFMTDCSKSDFRQDGDSNARIYTYKQTGFSTFLANDVKRDGIFDDFTWIRGDKNNPKKVMLLFNEAHQKQRVYSRTWYGPGNIKLVEKSDLNHDGILETTSYFNNTAKPMKIGGHIARIEIDRNNDGKTDIWQFPGIRMEFDTNADGSPDKYSLGQTNIKNVQLIRNPKIKNKDLKGQNLDQNRSWVLNISLIKNNRWIALIPRSIIITKK